VDNLTRREKTTHVQGIELHEGLSVYEFMTAIRDDPWFQPSSGGSAVTEQEWLSCADPGPMLESLQGKASDRKLRLFAVACCRRIWHIILAEETVWHKDEAAFWRRCQDAVVLAERFADGEATEQELAAVTAYPRPGLYDADAAMFTAEVPLDPVSVAAEASEAAGQEAAGRVYARLFPNGYSPSSSESRALFGVAVEQQEKEYGEAVAKEKRSQADFLRDIFGNPFQHVTLATAWRTPQVVALAQGIYDDRAFDRLPSLAEALEQAGCRDADLLAHCRGPGPHVRGCWLVDLILGKT
jgi:hypothetical protein